MVHSVRAGGRSLVRLPGPWSLSHHCHRRVACIKQKTLVWITLSLFTQMYNVIMALVGTTIIMLAGDWKPCVVLTTRSWRCTTFELVASPYLYRGKCQADEPLRWYHLPLHLINQDTDSRLCRHCCNLAEGGCLLSRFHFMFCHYFLGHVACWNLPWQGLFSCWHPWGVEYLCNCGRLAQLVERLTAEREVVGLNPGTGQTLRV